MHVDGTQVGELHGLDLAALSYEIKMYENLFGELLDQIHENLHQ